MEQGHARKICRFIEENYSELMTKLEMKIGAESDFMGRIEVLDAPPLFRKYMEGKGYCNRDKFFTYSPADVLAFFVMAQEQLFEDWEYNHEFSLLLGERIMIKELCGRSLKSTDLAVILQSQIREIMNTNKPVLLDFTGVRDATFDFLLVAFGYFYKEEDLSKLDQYLVFENLEQKQIYTDLRNMRNDILSFRNNPGLSRIANFLLT